MSAPIEDLVIESAEAAIRWQEQLNSAKIQPWSGVGGLVKVSDDLELRESGVVMKRIPSRGEQVNQALHDVPVPSISSSSGEEKERLKQLYQSYQQTMASFATSAPAPTLLYPPASSAAPHPSSRPPPPSQPPPSSSKGQEDLARADLSSLYQSPSVAEARAAAGLPPYLPPEARAAAGLLPYLPPDDTSAIQQLPKPPTKK